MSHAPTPLLLAWRACSLTDRLLLPPPSLPLPLPLRRRYCRRRHHRLPTQVLGGYRRLMRARTTLFAGDAVALAESRAELKKNFAEKAGERDAAAIDKHIEEIYDVEGFMKFNLAQGVMNERGSFEVRLTEEHNDGHPDGVEVNHVDNMAAIAAKPSSIVETSEAATRKPLPEQVDAKE